MSHNVSTIPIGTPIPEQLRLLGRRHVHAPGTQLLTMGHRPTSVLLLHEGLVKMVLPHDKGQTILAVRSAGAVLGGAAALTRTAHPASVVALGTCVTYHLGVVSVRDLVERDVRTWMGWLLDEHARLIVEANERAVAYHRQSVGTRLALQLVAWGHQFGTPAGDGGVDVAGLTQLDLAEAIAANPAYVDRVLTRLREDGLVITGRCLFHIPAPEELARAAREPTPPKT